MSDRFLLFAECRSVRRTDGQSNRLYTVVELCRLFSIGKQILQHMHVHLCEQWSGSEWKESQLCAVILLLPRNLYVVLASIEVLGIFRKYEKTNNANSR